VPEDDRKPASHPGGDLNRDLGFGSAATRARRLLNRDGSFNVRRKGLDFWTALNPYHEMLTMSWWRFYALVFLFYIALNVVFALAYMACGPDALNGGREYPWFERAFFFSIHTFATIGYGSLTPNGVAANMIVALEAVVGLLAFALATGMLFARFARPHARILYSRRAVLAPYQGRTGFMFRITNGRRNQLVEMQAKVSMSRWELADGARVRRFYQLGLEREKVAFFPLAWTIVHPVTESSPLDGWSEEELRAAEAEFLVLLTGFDETFSQTVYSRTSYRADEIEWGARFANLYEPSDEGLVVIDLARFHDLEPAALPLPDRRRTATRVH
jgi:inward rectifier potassium channel